jgi:hypothetical protein
MIKGVHAMFYCSEPEALRAFLRDVIGLAAAHLARRRDRHDVL